MAVEVKPAPLVQHAGTYTAPAKRPVKKTLSVWSPAGVKEEHPVLNARDLVRACGYSYSPPASAAPSAPAPAAPGASYTPAATVTESEPEASPALAALNALREEATALGVEVDNRWGKKRLDEEIAAAKKKADKTE